MFLSMPGSGFHKIPIDLPSTSNKESARNETITFGTEIGKYSYTLTVNHKNHSRKKILSSAIKSWVFEDLPPICSSLAFLGCYGFLITDITEKKHFCLFYQSLINNSLFSTGEKNVEAFHNKRCKTQKEALYEKIPIKSTESPIRIHIQNASNDNTFTNVKDICIAAKKGLAVIFFV